MSKTRHVPAGPISADSHITEPPGCFTDNVEKKYRDTAPRIVELDDGNQAFAIDGIAKPVPLGLISAAGREVGETKPDARFEDMHRGGWDPKARIAAQDRDGVAGEVIYSSVGMVLCGHPDPDYKHACFEAYNRWLIDGFVAGAPDRLFGMAQTAVRSVDETVRQFHRFKEQGFSGVMMPGDAGSGDAYDNPVFEPLWAAAEELELPLGFHILTTRQDGLSALNETGRETGTVSPMLAGWARGTALVSAIQTIIARFIWGGIFERHPKLRIVCVEADAGWAPHFAYRMDMIYERYRHIVNGEKMAKLPSEYFFENVYLTFQYDRIAFQTTHLVNPKRLLWASDYPHSDSTWPHSRDVIARETAHLPRDVTNLIVRENVAELYGLQT